MNSRQIGWWSLVRLSVSAFAILMIVALYLPFSDSALVFDDHNIFTNLYVYSYAEEIFSRYPRTFPYFTLGVVHVLSGGDLGWNRVLNTALHGLVVLSLFFFLRRAVSGSAGTALSKEGICAIVCVWMALNPVAVYGVGYLAQRTIVFATLFGLLSAILYLRAQQESRPVDVLSAALMAGLAMMSKEHAVLLPAAVLALTPLVSVWNRNAIWRAAAYLVLTVPCAVWVLLHRGKNYLGNNYEEYAGEIIAQMAGSSALTSLGGTWPMSIATQLLLFWKYLFLWLVPNPHWMSADLRIDFSVLWANCWSYVELALSVAVLLGAAIGWLQPRSVERTRRWCAVIGFIAIPFVVELSVVKVQEPFVLYRSYLWMPGYALLLTMLLMTMDGVLVRRECAPGGVGARRAFWVVMLVACAALFPLAQDRLRSLSSEEVLWRDALAKLPTPDVTGSDRIYYNLAGESYKRKDFRAALDWSEKVIAQNPKVFQGYLARGTSLLALGEPDAAMQAFDAAALHQPPERFVGYIEFKRCGVWEARGEREATIDCLKRSAKMGYEMARFRLKMAGIAE